MSLPNPTPGTWEVYDEINVCVVNGINRHICTCSGNARANARLIAASPDLLDVLEEFTLDVQSAYTHGDGIEPDAFDLDVLRDEWPDLAITYEKALKAIARTKGGV